MDEIVVFIRSSRPRTTYKGQSRPLYSEKTDCSQFCEAMKYAAQEHAYPPLGCNTQEPWPKHDAVTLTHVERSANCVEVARPIEPPVVGKYTNSVSSVLRYPNSLREVCESKSFWNSHWSPQQPNKFVNVKCIGKDLQNLSCVKKFSWFFHPQM